MPGFVDSFSSECNQWAFYLLRQKRLYFLGRILTLPKILKVVLDILKLRVSVLNTDSDSIPIGFLGGILHSLETYMLTPYLHLWQRVSIFSSYKTWKQAVNNRIFKHERACFLTASEEKPVVKLTLTSFANYSPSNFWSLTRTTLIWRPKSELRYVF